VNVIQEKCTFEIERTIAAEIRSYEHPSPTSRVMYSYFSMFQLSLKLGDGFGHCGSSHWQGELGMGLTVVGTMLKIVVGMERG